MPEPVSEKKVEKPSSLAEGEPSMRRPSGYTSVNAPKVNLVAILRIGGEM